MKLGCCIGIGAYENLAILKKIGFEYVETNIMDSSKMDPDEVARYREALEKTGLHVDSTAKRFPGIYNPAGAQTQAQLKEAYEKFCTELEATAWMHNSILVIGAGGARNYPTDMGYDEKNVYEQLTQICAEVISPAAAKYGYTVAIEGLNKRESPTFNLTEQSVAVARACGKDNIRVMTDYYHIFLEKEDMTKFSDFGNMIVHAHIANPNGRVMPAANDGADYASFFRELKKAGYNARLSCEARANGDYETTMRAAYEEMRKYVF